MEVLRKKVRGLRDQLQFWRKPPAEAKRSPGEAAAYQKALEALIQALEECFAKIDSGLEEYLIKMDPTRSKLENISMIVPLSKDLAKDYCYNLLAQYLPEMSHLQNAHRNLWIELSSNKKAAEAIKYKLPNQSTIRLHLFHYLFSDNTLLVGFESDTFTFVSDLYVRYLRIKSTGI